MKHVYKIPKQFEVKSEGKDGKEVVEMVDSCMVGEVELDVPGHTTRQQLVKDCKFKIENGVSRPTTEDEFGELLVEKCAPHIKSAKVVAKGEAGSLEINDVEDLGAFYEGQLLLKEIFMVLARGIRLGKPSKTPSNPSAEDTTKA